LLLGKQLEKLDSVVRELREAGCVIDTRANGVWVATVRGLKPEELWHIAIVAYVQPTPWASVNAL
jgi:hypothetical protein